jgi:hypothetical protein
MRLEASLLCKSAISTQLPYQEAAMAEKSSEPAEHEWVRSNPPPWCKDTTDDGNGVKIVRPYTEAISLLDPGPFDAAAV